MKDSEVFSQARTILKKRGRTTGLWEDVSNGSVCVNGACNVARYGRAGDSVIFNPASVIFNPAHHEPSLSEAMQSLGIEGHSLAMEYNDDPATTDEDIDELLERAAKLAEQREADGQQ